MQYLGKKEVTDIFFLHADEHQSFLEVDTIVLVVMAMHAQSTQNIKFAISLQYLKKEGRHEVDFLHGDKQTFLQVDALNIVEYCHSRPKYLKDEVDFCTDKYQSIKKVGTIIFDRCSQVCLKYTK